MSWAEDGAQLRAARSLSASWYGGDQFYHGIRSTRPTANLTGPIFLTILTYTLIFVGSHGIGCP